MQKSNRASIIVAIIAVFLILGGVFLLNQTFSNRNNSDDNDDTASVSSSSRTFSSLERQSSSSSEESSSQSSIDDPTETASSSSSLSQSSLSTSSSASSLNADLENGQAIITVDSVSGNTYQITTEQSQGINSRFFQAGASTRITLNGVTLETGNSYRVALSVTDTDSGFSISSFQILGEV